MKIRTMCSSCFTRFILESKKEHAHLLDVIDPEMKFIAQCPQCGSGYIVIQHIQGMLENEEESLFKVITLPDIYRFMVTKEPLNRMVQKSAAVLEAILKSGTPSEVSITEVGGDVYLDSLIVGKVKVYLTCGTRGAKVLKMEEVGNDKSYQGNVELPEHNSRGSTSG